MLSKGLGRHFAEDEKQLLFQDAKHIADLMIEVMDRRADEQEEGKQRSDPPVEYPRNPEKAKKGLEKQGYKNA